jgi:purine catabolism regulator
LPTLRTVLELGRSLGTAGHPVPPLTLLSGEDRLDTPVRWVAVSELEDPTPYLEGGELLLTTGLRLTARKADAYVARLVAAGVAGLGLAVGLTHRAVPAGLVDAAREHGLPLLEVPEPTPFIAVSQAVSQWLSAAENEAVTRAAQAQRDLTRAALAPDGEAAVVARLHRELSAQVLLLDAAGRVVHASPAGAAELAPAVEPQLDRLRGHGPKSAASFDHEGAAVVVQPLAAAGRVRGYLVVARPDGFHPADHQLVGVAVALVALALERTEGADTVRRDLRDAVLALLVDGIDAAQLPLAGVGWAELLSGPVLVLLADGASADRGHVLEEVEESAVGGRWRGAARRQDRLVVLVPASEDGADVLALGPRLRWGVSEAVAVDALGEGVRQAERALAAAGTPGVRRFADLTRDGVIGLLDPDAARGFADRLLGPLEERDRGDLVASVRAWLAHHGQWDAAAASLGVHRHTLRHRMRRAEEMLGRSLDDPDLRADLWVALAVRDRDAS